MNKRQAPPLAQILSTDCPDLYLLIRKDLFTAIETGGMIEDFREAVGGLEKLQMMNITDVCERVKDNLHVANELNRRSRGYEQQRYAMLRAAAVAMGWVSANDLERRR